MHEHSHSHYHERSPTHKAGNALKKALFLTASFMMIEFFAGWYSNSLALTSDAIHMLTDAGALALGFLAFWLSQRPSTPRMSFGYVRAEILGALFSGLLIWLLCGFLVYAAFLRFKEPPVVHGEVVTGVALLGLGINLLCMWILRSEKEGSLNVKAAYLHVIFDLLGSFGAMLSGVVIWFTGWTLVDPLMTLFLAALVLAGSWNLVREALAILMESAPLHLNPIAIETSLKKIPGVEGVHDLHVWAVSAGKPALSVHLISRQTDAVLSLALQSLEKEYGITHTTIQVEHPDQVDRQRCFDCVK